MWDPNWKDMERMHSIFVRETTKLQQNISAFANGCVQMNRTITALAQADGNSEEDVMRKIPRNVGVRGNNNDIAMKFFEQYMSKISHALNLASKFNAYLQLNRMDELISNDVGIFKEIGSMCPNHTENIRIAERSAHRSASESELGISEPYTVQLDLSSYVNNSEFHAKIINVEDLHLLIFNVRSAERKATILELPKTLNLPCLYDAAGQRESFGSIHPECGICRPLVLPSGRALLVDLGQLITLDERHSFRIPQHFQLVPPAVIRCRLVSVHGFGCVTSEPWEPPLLETVLKRNAHKEVRLKVLQNDGDILNVQLFEDHASESLRESMITSTQIKGPKPNVNPFLDTSHNNLSDFNADIIDWPISVFAADSCKTNVSTQRVASVTFMKSVTTFYAEIHELGIIEEKSELFWRQCDILPNSFLQDAPHIGDVVLAEYISDKLYYRAKVLHISDPKCSIFQVFFVDYGNIEEVPLSSMAKCALQNQDEPFRAVHCHMADIVDATAGDLEKRREAMDLVNMHLSNKRFKIEVLEQHMDNDSPELLMRIIDEALSDLPKLLIRMGYAKKI